MGLDPSTRQRRMMTSPARTDELDVVSVTRVGPTVAEGARKRRWKDRINAARYSTPREKTDKLEEPGNRKLNVTRS